ncbi:MAG: helix-turn-helix transcriptional regulator [Rhodanobacteraceae bacterium]|nr:helix-turn-helix transcriptional regulator [Rhodanobacteraceae bacterium]
MRSLFRHLADEQLSLRQLIADVRCDRARFWLRQTDLPIERIAERLGYAEASNFARCFKRWTGVTPRSYRQSRSACSDLDSAAAR